MLMPKEQIRKRAKRVTKKLDEHPDETQQPQEPIETAPEWIVNTQQTSTPFGILNPDLKSYLRDMDKRLTNASQDDSEEYSMMIEATLSEMSSHELALSTDPECALMVEHMLKRVGDFEKRVFADALMGQINAVISNSFGSHVIETLLETSKGTIMRESNGDIAQPPNQDPESVGQLRTFTTLLNDLVEEILPFVGDLILNQNATYPIRYLLHLLSGDTSENVLKRSKKSKSWLNRNDNFDAVNEQQYEDEEYRPPKHFKELFNRLRKALFDSFSSPAEIRAFGVSDHGAPILQLLLQYERNNRENDKTDSFLDSWLDGLIAQLQSSEETKQSGHITTTLLDTTASHTTETAIECASSSVFEEIWKLYFTAKGGTRCMKHPVGNFVYAKALARLGTDENLNEEFVNAQLNETISLIRESGSKLIKTGRSGPLLAISDVVVARNVFKDEVLSMIMHCFGLSTTSTAQAKHIIPCILEMKRWKSYRRFHKETFENDEADEESSGDERKTNKKKKKDSGDDDIYTVPGAQLIQSIYQYGSPLNDKIIESVINLDTDKLLEICGSSSASRIIDGLIESDNIAFKYKHKLRLKLIGNYHLMADMRVGSRVAEKIYETSDGYFREKIANSLIEHEDYLAGSPYGKYLSRKVDLSLFRRRYDDWKEKTAQEIKNAGLNKINNIKKAPRVFNGKLANEMLSINQSEDKRGSKSSKKRKNASNEDTTSAETEDKADTRTRQEKREEKRQRKYEK
ncbi:hypothetical protein E3Q11_01695 [Wallemia mellicola]|nr:hypothetical protein E3Q11_01695 [Wallemia mellicola]TIC74626.1 hypothetical protein E3Q00_01721 [Wallemia mellicola]